MKNPFKSPYLIINDLADFKLPYQIAGKIDLEVMTDRYNHLSNKPKPLEVRWSGKSW
jgi:hypothetical protein